MTPGILYSLAFAAGTMLFLLLLQRLLHRLVDRAATPVTTAHRLLEAGEVLGVFLIAASIVGGCIHGADLAGDLGRAAAYGTSAVVLLVLAGRLGVRVLLHARLAGEIARGNTAAGVAAAAHVAATAVILSRCLYDEDLAQLGISLLFFLIAQVTLHAIVLLFRALTAYDDAEQILGENLAAALSYAGITMAVGLLVGHAVEGQYTNLGASLRAYAIALLAGLALYPVRQLLVQCLILRAPLTFRGGRLDREIGEERNVGLGVLEAATYIATALMVGAVT